ncbi:hypothetical protein B484DRAFT_231125 [Ochromonadaceae sp. CCMP2298]|nr:hypothetical protein B484DRAFT_231125 [Ochromonadaceae sp. CCMP2298]|mmetsp:Transcript_3379/g.7732  ORF Transcript_3379/g.7732 Transcript_3379/m.7732 type:complete len:261 (+) Transcript_3379:546-1328(+)
MPDAVLALPPPPPPDARTIFVVCVSPSPVPPLLHPRSFVHLSRRYVSPLTDAAAREIGTHCPALQLLRPLYDSSGLCEEDEEQTQEWQGEWHLDLTNLTPLTLGCPRLTTLVLGNCPQLAPSSVVTALKGTCLQSLVLHSCRESFKAAEVVALLRPALPLRNLTLPFPTHLGAFRIYRIYRIYTFSVPPLCCRYVLIPHPSLYPHTPHLHRRVSHHAPELPPLPALSGPALLLLLPLLPRLGLLLAGHEADSREVLCVHG